MKHYLRVSAQQFNKNCRGHEHTCEPALIVAFENVSNSVQKGGEIRPRLSRCMLGKAAFLCIIKGRVSAETKTISEPH